MHRLRQASKKQSAFILFLVSSRNVCPCKNFPITGICRSVVKVSSRLRHILDASHKPFFSIIIFLQHPTLVFCCALYLTSSISYHQRVTWADFVSQQSTCFPHLTAVLFYTFYWHWQTPFYLPSSLNSSHLSALSALRTLTLRAIDSISHFAFVQVCESLTQNSCWRVFPLHR